MVKYSSFETYILGKHCSIVPNGIQQGQVFLQGLSQDIWLCYQIWSKIIIKYLLLFVPHNAGYWFECPTWLLHNFWGRLRQNRHRLILPFFSRPSLSLLVTHFRILGPTLDTIVKVACFLPVHLLATPTWGNLPWLTSLSISQRLFWILTYFLGSNIQVACIVALWYCYII